VGSRLVAFPVGDNQTILGEVDDPNVGNQPVARGTAERARETFETAIAQIRPGVEALMAQLRDLTARPEQVSLEFGIKFTAGADALIAKTSVEGNVKVTLTWKPQ
jgi:Trypsin-co-occurring domain 1